MFVVTKNFGKANSMVSKHAPIRIDLKRLPGAEDIPLPSYQTEGAVGMDLCACVPEPLVIPPGKVAAVPCGFAMAIPSGFEAQVRPRSGLVMKRAITVANAPGTIDPDYRGEVKVLLINLGDTPFAVTRGMRVAQMVIAPVLIAQWREVAELPPSERGEGGFGHTGK
jgi:dUTP pyrophosphatase